MRLRTLDLFCGAGGSSWGASMAGAQIVAGVDAWDLAVETFKANFPGAKGFNLTLGERSSSTSLKGLGKIDLILASPECTNHTCAKGAGPRDEGSKRTARYVINFARELNPRWIVIENVVQMRTWHGYKPLVGKLENLGYNILSQVIDASEFGVPQKRRRLFLLCDREAMPAKVMPTTVRGKTANRDIIDWSGDWVSRPLYREGRATETLARAERAMDLLGKGRPFLIVYYGSDGGGGWQPLDRPLRTLTTLDRFGLVTWIRGKPMLRMLQVPELLKAMSFDSSFVLPFGTRRDRIKLLGNGVCPLVMKSVVNSLTNRTSFQVAAE